MTAPETLLLHDHPFSRAANVVWMLTFKMLDPRASFERYAARLSARPASQAAQARNTAMTAKHGLA